MHFSVQSGPERKWCESNRVEFLEPSTTCYTNEDKSDEALNFIIDTNKSESRSFASFFNYFSTESRGEENEKFFHKPAIACRLLADVFSLNS